MTTAEKIQSIIDYYGLNAQRFAEEIRVKTKQSIYDLLGGRTKNISKSMADKILTALPEINPEWLITGRGEMIRSKYLVGDVRELTPDEEAQARAEIAAGRVTVVPLYNLDVRGGFEDPIETGVEAVDAFVPWPGAQDGDFAVEISGMSMYPTIPPGSRVLLRKVDGWHIYLEMNALYTLELNDDRRLLKEVHFSERGDNYLLLHSYNPRTPDQDIPKTFIRRVYKVVGTMTNYGY